MRTGQPHLHIFKYVSLHKKSNTQGTSKHSIKIVFLGPMLLFERFYHDGHPRRRFFACSAARDKKECGFFQWEGEEISEARKDAHRQILLTFGKPYSQACDTYKKLFGSLDGKPREHCLFCHSCNILFTPEQEEKHQSHECEYFEDLSRPTRILRPRENEKTQAVSTRINKLLLHYWKKKYYVFL